MSDDWSALSTVFIAGGGRQSHRSRRPAGLNNWRKHREDKGELERTWNVDPYSTGVLFAGWKEREEAVVYWRWRDTYDPLVVYFAKKWLLREGWQKHGLLRFREVPSERRVRAG